MLSLRPRHLGSSADNLHQLSDAELVKHAQLFDLQGSSGTEAIGEIYDRYQNKIFRYLWSHLPDRETAEDLTGEVFIRMVTSLPRYQVGQVPFQAWLYRIAHNLWIDYYRKNSQRSVISLEQISYLKTKDGNPEEVMESRLFTEKVRQVLYHLHAEEREAIILRFFLGLSLQDTASIQGKTLGAIKISQHRGLSKLRAILTNGSLEESKYDGQE